VDRVRRVDLAREHHVGVLDILAANVDIGQQRARALLNAANVMLSTFRPASEIEYLDLAHSALAARVYGLQSDRVAGETVAWRDADAVVRVPVTVDELVKVEAALQARIEQMFVEGPQAPAVTL